MTTPKLKPINSKSYFFLISYIESNVQYSGFCKRVTSQAKNCLTTAYAKSVKCAYGSLQNLLLLL